MEPDGVNFEKRETVKDLGVGHTSSFLSSVVGMAVEMADRARTRSEKGRKVGGSLERRRAESR